MKINKWGSWVLRRGSFQLQNPFQVLLLSNFTQHNSVFVLKRFKKKRKWHLRCHTTSVSPLYEPSLFACPWYITSIWLEGKAEASLESYCFPSVIRLSFYCFKVTFSFSEFTVPLHLYCWYIFGALVFSISEARNAVRQQRQSAAKRYNAAPRLIQNVSLAGWFKNPKLFFFFSTVLYLNQESLI